MPIPAFAPVVRPCLVDAGGFMEDAVWKVDVEDEIVEADEVVEWDKVFEEDKVAEEDKIVEEDEVVELFRQTACVAPTPETKLTTAH